MTLEVRELEAGDAAAYHAVRLEALATEPAAFGSSAAEWSGRPVTSVERQLAEDRASPDRAFLGAFDGTDLIGITGLVRHPKPKLRHKAEVVAVYVRPAWRRRGVAARLLDAVLDRARGLPDLEQLQLGVAVGNDAALRLYRSRGFAAFGLERHALRLGEQYVDEILMQRFLP